MASKLTQKHHLKIFGLVCITTAALLIFGCGGGGGGGGSSSHLTYTGLTTPATITEDNAQTLAAGAVDSGSSANAFMDIASLTGTHHVEDGPNGSLVMDITETFRDVVGLIDFSTATAPDMAAAIRSVEETISGACGGSATIKVSLNDETGAFSGSMTFNAYCGDGVTINGKASFSGVMNVQSEELGWFQLSFDYITGTSGSESMTMDGTIRYDLEGSNSVSVTMNLLVQDNPTGWVGRIDHYQMTVTEGSGYVDIEINGRLYDPDYGYVDIETTEPFRAYDYDDNPSSGSLVITGENGTAGGPTRARLTALNNDQCRLEVDEDGDGVYEILIEAYWDAL